MRSTLFILALVSVIIFSCSSQKTSKSQGATTEKKVYNAADLDGTDWKPIKLKMDDHMEDLKDAKAFLRFQTTNGSAAGNASCNRFGAKVSINQDSIRFTDVFSTKMFCEAVQTIENNFLDALGKTTRYEITDGQLYLFQSDNLLVVLKPSTESKSQN